MHKSHVCQNKDMYCIPKRLFESRGILIQTKKRLALSLKALLH